MNWKITNILFKDTLISAHYFASLSDGQNTVQVEEEVLEQEVLVEQAHKASLLLPIPPLLQATCF